MVKKYDLKPCPFCGSTSIYLTTQMGSGDYSMVVFCNNCKVSVLVEENEIEGDTEETRKRAIEAWNRRSYEGK